MLRIITTVNFEACRVLVATPGVYTGILRDNLAYSAQGEMNYEIRLTSLQLALLTTNLRRVCFLARF